MSIVRQNTAFETPEEKKIFWHTSAHIMAQAVLRLFPEAKFAIGPAIDSGFYYDIDLDHRFTESDLRSIEEEMRRIVREDLPITRREVTRMEALGEAVAKNQPYKIEIINSLPQDKQLSWYDQGEFSDLCEGPHLERTSQVRAFRLMSVAGAYWRGSEKNKMLQRIYGISFPKPSMLDEYLQNLVEIRKRDHRKIGREMDLFMFPAEGPGFPLYLPKGMVIRNELMSYWKELHAARHYNEIRTPIILNEDLWHTSGHWDHYKEHMYFTEIDGSDYAIKPMNCPGALIAFKRRMYSYRDMPVRLSELGHVHRHEPSGTLHGLMRVREFTQDDAHIFTLPSQVKDELKDIIKLIDEIYAVFGFEYKVELATQPQNSIGSREEWQMAEKALKEAVEELGIEYDIAPAGGAFYGPKLDFHLKDCIGRTWQCGTVQLDFQLSQRFDLTYTGSDGDKHRPVMIHRTVFGSIERFMGVLIEHFEGKLPLWLAPVQVKLISVSEKYNEAAWKLADEMEAAGLRTEVDARNEKTGYKVREAVLARDSYIIVVGEKEAATGVLSVRSAKAGDMGEFPKAEFIGMLQQEIANKTL